VNCRLSRTDLYCSARAVQLAYDYGYAAPTVQLDGRDSSSLLSDSVAGY